MHGILHMEHNFKGEHSSLPVINPLKIQVWVNFFVIKGNGCAFLSKSEILLLNLRNKNKSNSPPMNRNVRNILQTNAGLIGPPLDGRGGGAERVSLRSHYR